MTAPVATMLDDLNVLVSGQGGDGSLTVATLLAGLFRQRGLGVYTERDVLSRIRGGAAAAGLRVSRVEQYAMSDRLQLAIAFDDDGVRKVDGRLDRDSVLIYDDSEHPLPDGEAPGGARLYTAPFGRLAVRELGGIIYKNSIAVGIASRVVGLPDGEVRAALEQRFSRLRRSILDDNLRALEMGFALADEMGLTAGSTFEVASGEIGQRLQLTGNEALSFGFLVAGGRFFTGYPITPASEILEWLQQWLPQFGGVVWQAEDELSAVNMAIGASLAGVRSMTATSGPGIALMQEGIGQAGGAEIPLVIVDCQRGGPSTGLPTKPEQSDFNMMIFGGNGDFPRIVLAPGHPEDCFQLAIDACNLAERYQCPVYIAMDQATSQNLATVEPFDLDGVTIDRGKRLTAEQLAGAASYGRYAAADDGVSPFAPPGTPGGMSLVTGNERDPFGLVSVNSVNRKQMVDKRFRKIEAARGELPVARRHGDPEAEIGFIGVGAAFGPILDAMPQLQAEGLATQFFQPRTLWPVLDETVEFVERCRRVFVVEQNATAQLAKLLVREGAPAIRIRSVLRYDGQPLHAEEVTRQVLDEARSS